MTDKVQKIREEVERLRNELIQEREKGFGSDTDDSCILELQNVLTYIDSLQEETVSEDLEKEIDNYIKDNFFGSETYGFCSNRTGGELDCVDVVNIARHFANWQKEQDKETIELAEDHAMLAGMVKGKEDTVGNVRSILNKVAYRNNGLDVNGDYCEQPYIELDNEFRKLLK